MKKINAHVDGKYLFIEDFELNLPVLKRAIKNLVNLSQEIPGEMMKWDVEALQEMSLPDLAELRQIRAFQEMIDIILKSIENFEFESVRYNS